MEKEELIEALGQLGYQLFATEAKKIGKKKIYAVLNELAHSTDSRLIEAFPVVLANCAHRGINLDMRTVLSGHGPRGPKKRRLEKLILASIDLLNQEGLDKPRGFDVFIESLRLKYGDVLADENLALDKGLSVSTERLRNALRRYAADLEKSESAGEKERNSQLRSFKLNLHLSTLFSPKQKELVLKKLSGEPLSKTEQEYYSRIVKKKLEALSNSEMRKIASALTKK
ncbi:MAG TPA: hypothetical protein VMW89_17310 [Desulfatiglandales bacterium]|nr:hypothetical protein [Desulfatiglandales bacterium]